MNVGAMLLLIRASQIHSSGIITLNFVYASDHQFIQGILVKRCDVGLFGVVHQR